MDVVNKELLIRELAKQQAFGVKKGVSLGGSYAVVIPMTWLKWHATQIDDEYYFKMDVEGNTIMITPIGDEDLEGLTVKRKEG